MADTNNKVGIFSITPPTTGESIITQAYGFEAPADGDVDLAGAATVVIGAKEADITVKIPIKIVDATTNEAVSLPFSGPATLSSLVAPATLATNVTQVFADYTNTCTVESTIVEKLVQMEDHILFKAKQKYSEADCTPSATGAESQNVKDYWKALTAELEKEKANLTFSIVKLGCHQQSGSPDVRCVGGYKIPSGVTETTEASLKVFKATEKIKDVKVSASAMYPIRKSGSMGAAVVGASTASCTVSFDAAAYKFSYTNKGDDEVICIFEATYKTDPAGAYVYKATDGIAFTAEHTSVTSDDKTKLALSAGYLNSSWSLVTIIFIIGGVLLLAIVLIFWWFRPSDREPEEDD